MPRLVALVLLLAVGGPAVGLFAVAEAACEEGCGDDRGDACCPPACGSCVCAWRAPTMLPSFTVTIHPPEPQITSVRIVADTVPADPDPSEILHVPRSLA